MPEQSQRVQRCLKRGVDVGAALLGLVVLWPLLLIVGLIVWRKMGSPILFLQQRAGRHMVPFTLVKFRTMREVTDHQGRPLADRERLTKLGVWLRRTSLDELPQLWNLLRGDISLVGPRPMPLHYLPFFTERECARFSVLPGITGWAQIHGRNEASWDERFARDVWYVQNWTLRLDFLILAKTFVQVFQQKGVVVDARSIMLNLDEERSQPMAQPRDR